MGFVAAAPRPWRVSGVPTMTWPVLAFLLTAVFALGFHLGQKLAVAEAQGSPEPDWRTREALRHEAALFHRELARRSF